MNWIKEKRIAANLKQCDIAKQCGITQSAVSQIENGTKKPSVVTAKKIGAALGVEWSRLFD